MTNLSFDRPSWADQTEKPCGRRRHVIALIGFSLLALWIARPFLSALGCGIVLGVAAWPLYLRSMRANSRHISGAVVALIFTIAVGLILLLPLVLALADLGANIPRLGQWVEAAQQQGIPPPDGIRSLPLLGSRATAWWQSHLGDPAGARNWLSTLDIAALTNRLGALLSALAETSILFIVALLALYYVLRHGDELGRHCRDVAEWQFGRGGLNIVDHAATATRKVVNGTLLIAFGEGMVIGVGYAVTGVPQPVLFGVLTVAFALLPLGAWIVFSAAALILVIQEQSVGAASLFCWGTVVMLIGDQFIQPKLIGDATRVPLIWALVGILGGANAFGVTGLFVGPVVMSTVLLVWHDWIKTRTQARPLPMNAAPTALPR